MVTSNCHAGTVKRVAVPSTLCVVFGLILIATMPFHSSAQATRNLNDTLDEQSCHVFVQNFYDWYWNKPSSTTDGRRSNEQDLPSNQDALQLKPPVLSQQLIALIKKDEEASKAAGGEIINLDFDPFLNSNGPDGKYLVKNVRVVNGECKAAIVGGHGVHETAELKRTGATWLFINFQYSHYSEDGRKKLFPDDDLIHILSR